MALLYFHFTFATRSFLLPILLLHDHSRLTAHDTLLFQLSLVPLPTHPSKSLYPDRPLVPLWISTLVGIQPGLTLSQSLFFLSLFFVRTMSVNLSADLGSSTPILSCRPPTSSPLRIPPSANLIPISTLNMKDTSVFSRHTRNNP